MTELISRAFAFIDDHRTEMTDLWGELVNLESDSHNKAGVDCVAEKLREIVAADGADAQIIEFEQAGNMLIATYGADRRGAPVAFLGHMDTVFPKGTVHKRPFVIRDDKAYGPGVLDMKGGIVVLLYAIKALESAGYADRPLKVILAGDEEVAHVKSQAKEVIMHEVAGCVAAFNCETGALDNRIVVGRKGGATFVMETHGIAAHAGNAPRKGRSAILEMAHKVLAIHELTDWEEGTTFNVGTIQGGTVSNSIPDYARIEIDVRCMNIAAIKKFSFQLKEIADTTYVEGTTTELSGGISFVPMETTPAVMELFELVAKTAQDNGLGVLSASHSGGGSDSANAVLAGVPTLCALGVKGQNSHTAEEYALVESLFERAKLLAACVPSVMR